MVSVGLVDRLGEHFNSVVGPIGESGLTQLVLGGLNLLVASTACLHARYMYMYAIYSCLHVCFRIYDLGVLCVVGPTSHW